MLKNVASTQVHDANTAVGAKEVSLSLSCSLSLSLCMHVRTSFRGDVSSAAADIYINR
jgi:hypothetical protein